MAEENTGTPTPSQDPVEPTTPVETADPTYVPPVETADAAPPVEPVEPVAPPVETAPPPEPTDDPPEADARVVPAADGYVLPEGVSPDIGQFANEHGFTQEQLDATITQFTSVIQGQEQARLVALRTLGEAHVKNWGSESAYKVNLAKRALQQNDPDGKLSAALNESGYGNHPAVLDFLTNLGKSMEEGGYLKSNVHRPQGEKTVAQAMYPNLPSNE